MRYWLSTAIVALACSCDGGGGGGDGGDDGEPFWEGDFLAAYWEDPDAVAALHAAVMVTGDLELAVPIVELPALEVVTGGVLVSPQVEAVVLPRLRTVGRDLGPPPPGDENGDGTPDEPVAVAVNRHDLRSLIDVGGSLTLAGMQADGVLRLDQLRGVGGDLVVRATTVLFHAPLLVEVDGTFMIDGEINDVKVPALTTVGGDLWIESRRMENLAGFPALTTVIGNITVRNASSLTAVELPALLLAGGIHVRGDSFQLTAIVLAQATVRGPVSLSQTHAIDRLEIAHFYPESLYLSGMRKLRSLRVGYVARSLLVEATALEEVTVSGAMGMIQVRNNSALRRIAIERPYVPIPLPGPMGGGEPVSVTNNPVLEEFAIRDGLFFEGAFAGNWRLHKVTADVELPVKLSIRNGAFTDLSGLGVANGTIRLMDIASLTSAASAPFEWAALTIENCDSLVSLDDLPRDVTVGIQALRGNDGLTHISDVADSRIFVSLDVDVDVKENSSLTSLRGLRVASAGADLRIVDNQALVDIAALGQLEEAEYLVIVGSPALTSVDALANLRSVQETFAITRTGVTDLDGLAALRFIGARLSIAANDRLASIAGLSGLAAVGEEIYIERNPLVPQADIDALKERLGHAP
jgi:hypothetical protein